jgi:hypothetical protein
MAQKSWYYQNPSGVDYHVSIYHGDKSGHVLIYSDAIIITVDFMVKSDKVYSFMLGDELFDLKLYYVENKSDYILLQNDTQIVVTNPGLNNYPTADIIKALLLIVVIANIAVWLLYAFNNIE